MRFSCGYFFSNVGRFPGGRNWHRELRFPFTYFSQDNLATGYGVPAMVHKQLLNSFGNN